MIRGVLSVCIVVSLCLFFNPLEAHWADDGVPVCVEPGAQSEQKVVVASDNSSIIVWTDDRTSSSTIRAQKMNSQSQEEWTYNGVLVSTVPNGQVNPDIIPFGNGAVITFSGYNNEHIFVQGISSGGSRTLGLQGISMCTSPVLGNRIHPKIVETSPGFGFVSWEDTRNGGNGYDLYVHCIHFDTGMLNPAWPVNGAPIITGLGDQTEHRVVADGSGGAFCVWTDTRNGNKEIYAQHIDSDGNQLWLATGALVATGSYDKYHPEVVLDGSGGIIVAWYEKQDIAPPLYQYHIRARRILANGLGSGAWPTSGLVLDTGIYDMTPPKIVTSAPGEAIITWSVDTGDDTYDVKAQRVDAIATVYWATNGVEICPLAGNQTNPQIVPDGSGGAVITFEDSRDLGMDIYAQRIDQDGIEQWGWAGIAVSTSSGGQVQPMLAASDANDVCIVWQDSRYDPSYDLYTMRINQDGDWSYPSPEIYAILDIPEDNGGWVNLCWYASSLDPWPENQISEYRIYISLTGLEAAALIADGYDVIYDPGEIPEDPTKQVIWLEDLGGATYSWSPQGLPIDAKALNTYSKTVGSVGVHTEEDPKIRYWKIVAHTDDPEVYWVSQIDSGYSLDNLPPEVPVWPPPGGIGAIPSHEGLHLSWAANIEPDFLEYRIYRDMTESFIPSQANLIAATAEAECLDGDWSFENTYYYKISAVDMHENENGYAEIRPVDITDASPGDTPTVNMLNQNFPNPFNPSTNISFAVSKRSKVRLNIYDITGRLVRRLLDEERDAGTWSVDWDGCDDRKAICASGTYFCRMETDIGYSTTVKMILLR